MVDEFATPRPIAGWRIVFTAFCMALFAWGLGFYALSVYAQYLAQQGRFSAGLLAAATTWHFLVGAAALYVVDAAVARVGRRRVVLAGIVLLAGCAAALPWAATPVQLFAAYAGMAFGWAATSGTAITQIVGAWFAARRGLALNLALTGASAAGFLVVPVLVAAIERLGLAQGVAATAGVIAAALAALVGINLVEPGSAAGSATPAVAASVRLPVDAHLVRLCALFGIGWLAQVAFLAQQLPLLVPKVGAATATLAVAATTAASLLGRLALANVVDRLDHRRATAGSFGVQAVGMALVAASDAPVLVVAGCVLFGFSVGNVITLPALYAQREFAPAHYAAVITRVWSVGQVLYAFGPLGAGLLLARTGSATVTLVACAACQLVAVALSVVRGSARGTVCDRGDARP